MRIEDDGSLKLSSRDGTTVFSVHSAFSEAAAAGHGPPMLHQLGGGRLTSVQLPV